MGAALYAATVIGTAADELVILSSLFISGLLREQHDMHAEGNVQVTQP